MTFMKKLLLCSAVLAARALAGSRAWQPSVEAEVLDRRYFYVDKDLEANPQNDAVPWPNRQIRYCFEDDEAKTLFQKDLKAAHERWQTIGLGTSFRLDEVSAEDCKDDRENVLLIAKGPSLQTYVGFPQKNAGIRKFSGPYMYLSNSNSVGMLDRVANYAHELGHAWGLYHEHQNPNFWKGANFAKDGDVFGTPNEENWRCTNLQDYQSSIGLVVQNPNGYNNIGADDLCSNWNTARVKRFSASNYLPMPGSLGVSQPGKQAGDVDWNSLMIYPSGAGGRPGSTVPGDDREPILMKPLGGGNFERIKINTSPSQMDIAAMQQLYGSEDPIDDPSLLQKKKPNIFKKMFGKSKGDKGCK